MAMKIVLIGALVAIARAGIVAPIANVAVNAKLVDSEFDPNPQYTFAYDVQDALTGDSKSQVETRNGGLVQGQYSVNDPDGTRRIVDYSADPINGFNAVVRKEPQIRTIAAAPVVGKIVAAPAVAKVAAPVVAKVTSPVAYTASVVAAPVVGKVTAPVAYTAPVVAAPVAAPVAYTRPAPIISKITAPVAYTAPIAYAPSPFKYAAPLVGKISAPVAYTTPLAARPVAYSAAPVATPYRYPFAF